MNFKRIGRLLVCFFLISALLINVSPIKAKADVVSGGLVAAGATGAVVSVPVAIAIGATLIALGIIADAASQNPYALQKLASDVGDALAAAGTYVQDGMVEMYRFVTDTGEAVYYASADFMNSVYDCLWSQGVVYSGTAILTGNDLLGYYSALNSYYESTGLASAYILISDLSDRDTQVYISQYPFSRGTTYYHSYSGTKKMPFRSYAINGNSYRVLSTNTTNAMIGDVAVSLFHTSTLVGTLDGLSIADFPNSPIDGTSARAWSETYANRGLYIASGGNQGAPDDGAEGNDGWKFLLPLSLASAAILAAMSQAEQWTGTTPPEFDDYTEKEELTVTPAPEFDGYQAIEIAPVTNPNPDPNPDPGPGSGSDPDSGGDSAESTWWQRLYQWLLEIKTSINELPNKFDEHFENLNNNIQEVPNKFETWIQNLQTSVDAVAESILGTAEEINAAISNLPNAFFAHVQNILSAIAAVPQAIISGIQTVLQNLFVPDADFIPGKVQALQSKYSFLLPVKQTFEDLKFFFNTIGATPPIIYIDLGEAVSPYEWGGRVKFLDLTWFAQYKPVTDLIIAAFLWLWLIWRLLQALPGIIQGTSGMWGIPESVPDFSFKPLQPSLPSGESAGRLGATSPLQPDSRPRLGTSRYSSRFSGGRKYWKHNGG